jgi:hypothetical protein
MPAVAFEPPRELTSAERTILDFLIEANIEHRDTLRRLLRDSKVTGLCSCGCESPKLTIDEQVASAVTALPNKLPEEAAAKVDGLREPFAEDDRLLFEPV